MARAGEDATPAVPAPVQLRPFLQFARLPAKAVEATRRAIDTDEEFRRRVAEVVEEEDVGRAGWLWLTRPPGWEDDLDGLLRDASAAGDAAADRRAENEARRRLAGAEAAVQRAEASAAAAVAESARAAATLAEERRARRAAAGEVEGLARQLELVTGERDRARADRDRSREEASRAQRRAAALKQVVDDLRAAPTAAVAADTAELPAAAAAPAPDPVAEQVRAAAGALRGAAVAAARMAASLEGAATALGGGPQASAPQPSAPEAEQGVPRAPRTTRPARPRRIAVPLPPGVLDDSVEAADHLVRVPGMSLIVDGYNASLTGWPELAIAEQRRRLVDALAELAARTGVDASVVFDGADTAWPAASAMTSRHVRVSFSPGDVEADDVILERVAGLDASRRVMVASSDRRVRDGAAAMGANVISSAQLLGALRR